MWKTCFEYTLLFLYYSVKWICLEASIDRSPGNFPFWLAICLSRRCAFTSSLSKEKGKWRDKGGWAIFRVPHSGGSLPVEGNPEGGECRVNHWWWGLRWEEEDRNQVSRSPMSGIRAAGTCSDEGSKHMPPTRFSFWTHQWSAFAREWATINKATITRVILICLPVRFSD